MSVSLWPQLTAKYIFVAENRVSHPFKKKKTSLHLHMPEQTFSWEIHRKLHVFTFPVTAVNSSFFVMNDKYNVSLATVSNITERRTPPAETVFIWPLNCVSLVLQLCGTFHNVLSHLSELYPTISI